MANESTVSERSKTEMSDPVQQHSFSHSVSRLRKVTLTLLPEGVVILVVLALWVPRLSGSIDLRWDGAVYYLLGTSLAKGDGYRIPSEPGSPQALQYPPLLPAVVAVHERILGTTEPSVVGPWLRFTYATIFAIYALAVLRLARRYLGPLLATGATLLCLLNPYTIFLSDLLFAELPFALISVLFVLVAGTPLLRRENWSREAGSFALASVGFFLRSAGIVLLAAWALEAGLQRRWRPLIVRGGLALLPVIGWQSYVAHVRATPAYSHPAYSYQRASYQYYNVSYAENLALVDPFAPELGKLDARRLVARLAKNLASIPAVIGEIVSAKEKDWRGTMLWAQRLAFNQKLFPLGLVKIPLLALAALALAGLAVFLLRQEWLPVLVVSGSIALVCVTPWPAQFARYLQPLSPFLTIAAVLGLYELCVALSKTTFKRAGEFVPWLGAALLLCATTVEIHTAQWAFTERAKQPVVFASRDMGHGSKWFMYDRSWQVWEQAVNWLNGNVPSTAIIAATSPHFYYLQTGRLAVFPPMEADLNGERKLLDSVPVSYVIVDELASLDAARRYVLPAVESDTVNWKLVYKAGDTAIYERRRAERHRSDTGT